MNSEPVVPSHTSRFSKTEGFADSPDPRVAGLVSVSAVQRKEISLRAFSMWEEAGRPDDRSLAHWLAAEAEILHRPLTSGS
ncbi:hypothetical protein CMV30_03775 [Nibricoccus aquaticus]|uniref:DUF2934 domain-containing protein n=1 Tax=Nibricoccus aquaticus TaxID=2576891 RepID=A0A290Q3A0_9BACT|nr:hypothetical protein CMV30_03775 [Nibricoccus aquaticus]